ncbi:MAG: rRNA (cytidine1920-2-O)/16S rRNA (cytidine1409-2-O)-methyltransferase [Candidatus Dependentiae bacterium]|nr:rRNA (cytidine1920-2-O)/16S rRNA (cytidine1409-2-O)-methyltransferase [Candidatus Dependentiae bacterium]
MSKKQRLDVLLVERYPQYSRSYIHSIIMQGKVLHNGQPVTKPGTAMASDAELTLSAEQPKWVCRAGAKLEAALDHFKVDVAGLTILDAGLSTGGFTDCMLQRGAKKIYGIDVGHGQVHEKIAADPRVVVMEKTNLRYVTGLPDKIDLATLDVSFISLLTVMPAVISCLAPHGRVICLIKPQFEAGRHQVRRGGLIEDPAVHQEVIDKVVKGCRILGLTLLDEVIPSPLPGATSGNIEFLALFELR